MILIDVTLFQFDVSASMSACWDTLQKGWNAVVGPVMTGGLKIY